MQNPNDKIFASFEDFNPLLEKFYNGKIVFTNGCFDLIHRGHCEYLQAACKFGDFLIIGLNTDDSVRRLKGVNRPIQPFDDRAYVLASLFFVDAIVSFDEDTPLELIIKVRPDILVKGEDYEIEQIVGAKEVLAWGGRVERIPLTEGNSTSEIIDKIKRL